MTHRIDRRTLLGGLAGTSLAAATSLTAALPTPALAQAWPSRPIRFILGFPAGGTADVLGRLVAERLGTELGQTVVVENRAGASGNIATEHVARSAPDGYTLLLGTQGTHAANAALFSRLPFDPVADFTAIAPICAVPNMLVVTNGLPVNDVAGFVAHAKANPNRVRFGSSGNGTSIHLAGELFKGLTRVEMEHVPYRGSAPALTDLVAGRIEAMFELVPGVRGQLGAGNVRALAVASRARLPAVAQVPTFGEVGYPSFVTGAWFGVFSPAAVPEPIVARLAAAFASMTRPGGSLIPRFEEVGAEAMSMTRPEFVAFIASETTRWAEVVRRSGARLD
jgi:tripartite-type tricarboxylate transporter receptor subunit TctC